MFVSKHLPPVPVWFHQEPLDASDGWTETPAIGQQIIAIKSVLYTDGTTRRWYKVSTKRKQRRRETK